MITPEEQSRRVNKAMESIRQAYTCLTKCMNHSSIDYFMEAQEHMEVARMELGDDLLTAMRDYKQQRNAPPKKDDSSAHRHYVGGEIITLNFRKDKP